MSGFILPLRSPWFGDTRTSATTQESGRNSDTNRTIRAPGVFSVACLTVRNTAGENVGCGRGATSAGMAAPQQAAVPRLVWICAPFHAGFRAPMHKNRGGHGLARFAQPFLKFASR